MSLQIFREKNLAYFFGCCFAICLIIYLPVALSPYIFHDDFLLFDGGAFKGAWPPTPTAEYCRESPVYWAVMEDGRPVSSESLCFIYSLSVLHRGVLFFMGLRLFSVLMVATACSLFATWLFPVVRDRLRAVILAVLIFALPGIQVFVSAAISASHTFTIPLTIIGILVLGQANLNASDRFWPQLFSKQYLFRVIAAALILTSCLSTYQATALIFLVPTAALLCFSKLSAWPKNRILVVRHLASFGLGMLFYLISRKLILRPLISKFNPQVINNTGRPFKTVSNFGELWQNIVDFSDFLSRRALNLWFVQDTHIPATLFFYFICLTLVFALARTLLKFKQGKVEKLYLIHLGQIATLFCCVFVGVNIVFFAYAAFPAYRVLLSYSAVVVILLIWSIRYWLTFVQKNQEQIFKFILLSVLSLVIVLAQYYTVRYFAFTSIVEMNFLEASLQPLLKGTHSTATIFRPVKNTWVLGGEFSRLNTYEHPYPTVGMLLTLYDQYHLDPTKLRFPPQEKSDRIVVVDERFIGLGTNPEPIIINMNLLLGAEYNWIHSDISASSAFENLSPDLILAPKEFPTVAWHAQTPPQYPEWLTFDFHAPQRFNRLAIRSQDPGDSVEPEEFAKRGPKELSLQISSDGEVWQDAYSIENACTAAGGEWQEIQLPQHYFTSYVRLVFKSNCGEPNWLTIENIRFESSEVESQ